MGIRRHFSLVASVATAWLLASGVAFVAIEQPAQAAFPGGNGKMVFSLEGEIYTAHRDGTDMVQLTESPGDDIEPSFSSDGKRIAWTHVSEDDSRNVWVMNADGTGKKWITNMGGESPSFSPDGTKVAYQRWDGSDFEIFWKVVDGTLKKQVTNNVASEIDPDWSTDGTRIAFSSDAEYSSAGGPGTRNIFTIRPDGTGWKKLTNFGPTLTHGGKDQQASDPDWAPDGREIVFGVYDVYNIDDFYIASIGPDGTGLRTVHNPPGTVSIPRTPVFSPDGTKIAFMEARGKIRVVNRDGTGLSDTGVGSGSTYDWGVGTFVDTTAPTVEAPRSPILEQGSVIGDSTVPVFLAWVEATEGGSGVARYELQHSIEGGAFTNVALPSQRATFLRPSLAAGKIHQFQVRAQDGAGNWSDWKAGSPFTVDLLQETHQAITYIGGWTLESSPTASGDHIKHTSTRGARATFTFTGDHGGWVASKGPNRGRAEVWLNGNKVRTVDLYAPTAQPRKMVLLFSEPFPNPSHTLEIRVLGTKNASSSGTRVDVDAFVELR